MTINKPPLRILFVCLGNICRSPAAEAVFAQFAANNNLNVELDSAGLSDWHEGEKADKRTRQTARERGYEVTSLSRPFKPHDFERFDMIIAMDDKNFSDLEALAANEQQAKKLYIYFAFSITLARRHLLSLDRGRVSVSETRSPIPHSLFSS